MARLLVALALMAVSASAQELQGACITCSDNYRKCEFDCLMPTYREDEEYAWPYNQPESMDQINVCLDVCQTDYDSCSDTDDAVECTSCMTECAKSYDASMFGCLQKIPTNTKNTYGENQDACANDVSLTMDACSQQCFGSDRFSGWAPEGLAEQQLLKDLKASYASALNTATAAAAASETASGAALSEGAVTGGLSATTLLALCGLLGTVAVVVGVVVGYAVGGREHKGYARVPTS